MSPNGLASDSISKNDLFFQFASSLDNSIDYLANRILGLSPERRNAASNLCGEFKLSKYAEIRILSVLCELIEFEASRESMAITPKERTAIFMDIAEKSRALFDAIGKLSLSDSVYLHGAAIQFAKDWPDDMPEKNNPVPTAAQLEAVGTVAQAVAMHLKNTRPSAGARPTRQIYAAHISNIWRAVRSAAMKPGRGGPFENLCKGIFQIAGIHSSPEGSIKIFKSHFLPIMASGEAAIDAYEAALDEKMSRLLEIIEAAERRKIPPGKQDE